MSMAPRYCTRCGEAIPGGAPFHWCADMLTIEDVRKEIGDKAVKQRLIDLLETHQGDPMVAGEWSEQIIGWLLPEIRHIQAEVWDECEEALHNFIVDPFGDRPSNPYDRPASVPEDR